MQKKTIRLRYTNGKGDQRWFTKRGAKRAGAYGFVYDPIEEGLNDEIEVAANDFKKDNQDSLINQDIEDFELQELVDMQWKKAKQWIEDTNNIELVKELLEAEESQEKPRTSIIKAAKAKLS